MQTLIDSLSVGLLFVNQQGDVVRANRAIHAFFTDNFAIDSLIGQPLLALLKQATIVNEEEADRLQIGIANLVQGDDTELLFTPSRCHCKEPQLCSVRITRSPYNDGELMLEQKQIALHSVQHQQPVIDGMALAASETKYRTLFESLGTANFLVTNGKVVDVNEQAMQMFGYSRQEMLRTTPNNFSPEYQPDGRLSSEAAELYINAACAGEPQRFYWLHKRADGTEFDTEVILNGLEINGEIYWQAALRDITAEREAWRAMQESEYRYRLLADNSNDFISCHDPDGNYLYASPSSETLLGYAPEELVGTSAYDYFHPDDRAAIEASHDANRTHGVESTSVTYRIRRKDGSYIWFETTSKPYRDQETGELIEIICNSRDVTERRKTEEALRLAELEAATQKSADDALRKSEAQFRNLVEATQDFFWEVDNNAVYTYISPIVEAMLGYTPEEMIGKTPFDFMTPEEAQRVAEEIGPIFSQALPITLLENSMLHKDGHGVVLETSGVPFFADTGELLGYRGIDRDITQRVDAEQRVRLSAKILEQTPEGVVITDDKVRILSVNPAFEHTTGYKEHEVIGQTPAILASGRHHSSFYEKMWQELLTSGNWQGEIWNRRKDGEIYPEWLNITAIRDDSGTITNFAGIFSDISTQEHVRKRLHNLAYYDALTDLPNRELFQDRLTNSVVRARREQKQVALLFFDLDRFKNINDSLGHTIGDLVLKAVADNFRNLMREGDTVARLGGDEFTIILNDFHDTDEVGGVAQRLLETFSQPFTIGAHELFLTTSIGISVFPEDGDSVEALIKNADTAMYRSKELGRNTYQFYDTGMSDRFAERLLIENDLRRALELNQLYLVYQPQVNLDTHEIIGMEALIRWQHPEKGNIPPYQFIPVAEETGLILPIGNWVMETALQQARKWLDLGIKDFRMSVNLSALQLRQAGFINRLDEILARTGCPGENVELEMTESLLMENTNMASSLFFDLHERDISIAIDDFGTGYSSLSYLKRFTIDRLKIDKSFIDDVTVDYNDAEIAATIIAMGRNLDMKVIAEGVEDKQQLAFLRKQGCNEVQGYLFSRPIPADQLEPMLGKPLMPQPSGN